MMSRACPDCQKPDVPESKGSMRPCEVSPDWVCLNCGKKIPMTEDEIKRHKYDKEEGWKAWLQN